MSMRFNVVQDGDGKQLTPGQSAAAGFVAACIGPTLNNPFDVVKVSKGSFWGTITVTNFCIGCNGGEGLKLFCVMRSSSA